jgi:hypothetical protein
MNDFKPGLRSGFLFMKGFGNARERIGLYLQIKAFPAKVGTGFASDNA